LELEPGKLYSQTPPAVLHLSSVALDHKASGKQKSSLIIVKDDVSFTACTLRVGGTEQWSTDLIFETQVEVSFQVFGDASLHVIGYLVYEDEEESDEDDYQLNGMDLGLLGQDSEEGESEEDEEENTVFAKPAPVQKRKRVTIVESPKEAVVETPSKKAKAQRVQVEPKEEVKTPLSKKDQRKTKKEENQVSTPKTEAKSVGTPRPGSTPLKETQQKKLPNGLGIEDLVLGSGIPATAGKKVQVKYTGRFENGKVFDSSLKAPFSFRLGTGQVIKGWDMGVKGMKVGGKRKLIVPPALGYGAKGVPGSIPANATLHFEVELIDA